MIGITLNSLIRKRFGSRDDADGQFILVVGLGNPEKQYDGTRHNAGFAVIDRLAETYGIPYGGTQKKAAVGKGVIGQRKVMLAKPLTYMNLSGEAVRGLADYYKIDTAKDLIVISDDIDLPVGMVRIRKKGSAGGHNGLKNIIRHLGHEQFVRVRVGVGNRPAGKDMIGHVLGSVPPGEREAMREGVERAAQAVASVINDGPDKAMNLFNTKTKDIRIESNTGRVS